MLIPSFRVDPRIGYTPEEADAALERYEDKFGKPREGILEERAQTTPKMAGFGADQTALGLSQDSEGHS